MKASINNFAFQTPNPHNLILNNKASGTHSTALTPGLHQ